MNHVLCCDEYHQHQAPKCCGLDCWCYTAILEFRGQYRFLSNFYWEPDGTFVEAEYQAQKAITPGAREGYLAKFRHLPPGEVKRLGSRIELRHDWEQAKVDIMRDLVWQKFLDHPSLARLLVDTGSVMLVEGNSWGDKFWGMTRNGYGMGENWLGKILMEVRGRLVQDGRAEK